MKIAIMGSGNINVAFALDLIKAGIEMVIKERDSYSPEKNNRLHNNYNRFLFLR